MRFLDIAVAALIGMSAISAMLVWNPAQGDSTARQEALRSGLRNDVLSFLEVHGVPWLYEVTPQEFCDALSSSSTPSFNLTGKLGSFTCGVVPASASAVVSITLTLPPRMVTLTAWSDGAA